MRLIELIVRLGDDKSSDKLANQLSDLVIALSDPNLIMSFVDLIFDCVTGLPTKTAIYATLVAVLGAENADFLEGAVERTKSSISRSLRQADYRGLKFLVRFVAELANANVIPYDALHGLCEQVLDSSLSSSTMPQHLLDTHLFIIMTSLSLAETEKIPHTLLSKLEKGISSRTSLSWLSAFESSPNTSSASENLIADFNLGAKDSIEELYLHFSAHASTFGESALVNTESDENKSESSLFGKMRLSIRPYNLKSISERLFGASTAPKEPSYRKPIVWFGAEEANIGERDKLVSMEHWIFVQNESRIFHTLPLYHYPQDIPRANFSKPKTSAFIFPKIRTSGEGKLALSDLERIFFADYIIDLAYCFRSATSDFPAQMAFGEHLAEHCDLSALTIESLLLDLLSASGDDCSVPLYTAIITSFIQKNQSSSLAFNEAMDRLFSSIAYLRPTMRQRLASFLALYLNNIDYKWHWTEWVALEEKANSALPSENGESLSLPATRFLQLVTSKMVRLSYYERISTVIKAIVPERAAQWLGAKPESTLVATGPYASDLASQLVEKVKSRPSKPEDILEPIFAKGEAPGLSIDEICQVLLRAILLDSSVSLSMLQGAMNRYAGILRSVGTGLIRTMPAPSDIVHLYLTAARDFSINSPQQFVLITNAMMVTKVITPEGLIRFALNGGLDDSNRLAEIVKSAAQHSLLFARTIETDILNLTSLDSKNEPNSDPQMLATRTLEKPQTKEALAELNVATDASHAFFNTLFSTVLGIFTSGGGNAPALGSAMAKDFFLSLASTHQSQLVASLAHLNAQVDSLPTDAKSEYEKVRFLASNY